MLDIYLIPNESQVGYKPLPAKQKSENGCRRKRELFIKILVLELVMKLVKL